MSLEAKVMDNPVQKIVTGRYIYEDYFNSFRAGSNNKEIAAKVNQAFFKNLQASGIVLVGSATIKIGDIACGPGKSIIESLQSIDFSAGFDIRATDYNPKYAGIASTSQLNADLLPEDLGQAYNNLLEAKLTSVIPLIDFSVKQGDAFVDDLSSLLSKTDETIKPNTFKIVYLSHGIYHVTSDEKETCTEKVDRIIKNIAYNIIEPEGIGLLIHQSNSPNSFQYFSAKYGNNSNRNSPSDTYVKDIDNPTSTINECCKKHDVPCYSMKYLCKLYFSEKVKEYATYFRDPTSYHVILSDLQAVEDYKKLLFIVQRAADEIIADESDTGMKAFIDELMGSLQKDDNSWYLSLVEEMQIILNPKSSTEFREKIRIVLTATERQLPEIIKKGNQTFLGVTHNQN